MSSKLKNGLKTEPESLWSKYKIMITIVIIFYGIAITLYLTVNSVFYLLNFTIIGTSIALGMGLWPALPKKHKHIARKISQTLVGGYLFFGLGLGLIYTIWGVAYPENMQFEGFWFFLLAGLFQAAVLHYSIAKIIGPFVFGRVWCGWACWTAAVLDYLPWKNSPGRIQKWGRARYIHFVVMSVVTISLILGFNYTLQTIHGAVILKTVEGVSMGDTPIYSSIWAIPETKWFLIGNLAYYVSAIGLASITKDNRAFCKYLCPITVFLRVGAPFARLKVGTNKENCIKCGSCNRACPMDVDVQRYVQEERRVTAAECIFCQSCINACPSKALFANNMWDRERPEYLCYRS